MTSVLCVEDDSRLRAMLLSDLTDGGFDAVAVATAEDAELRIGAEETPDVLLLDVRLPGMSGIELIRRLAGRRSLPPTVVISGEATISETVEALRLGVLDFIEKPFGRERLLTSVRNAASRSALESEVRSLRVAAEARQTLLGESPAMNELRDRIARAAATDARVLVRGPSGSGTELVAAALHSQGDRRDKPLVKLNCASIAPGLVEDELFGHARGAFTGAIAAKAGLFEEADGGVLFLDEVGDMELQTQARLLRVLEDGRVRRLGETRERVIDVRVIAATNQALEELVAEGAFREDLYYRLTHLCIDVPPLSDRPGDVRLLATHFVSEFGRLHRARQRRMSEDTLCALERYGWPGNVRELRNVCERLVVFGGDPITPDQLPPAVTVGPVESAEALLRTEALAENLGLRDVRERCEREYIVRTLERVGWNVAAAARILGIGRTALHDKLALLGVRRPTDRPR